MEIIDIGDPPPEPIVTKTRCFWSKINKKTYNYMLNGAIFIALVVALILVLYFFKEYLKSILLWVDSQNPTVIFILFLFLFTLVSFPVAIGYLVLVITAGYLFGILKGLGTVIVCANVGVAIAHYSLRAVRGLLPLDRLMRNDTARALLKVISGPSAFKIVFFTRLTPLPFALQNTVFAVSEVRGVGYHVATALGLLPAQFINVYLGSTLRSMHDVLQNSHLTGYIVFAVQILIGLTLMAWVVTKARKELTLMILEAELGRDVISTSSSSASVSYGLDYPLITNNNTTVTEISQEEQQLNQEFDRTEPKDPPNSVQGTELLNGSKGVQEVAIEATTQGDEPRTDSTVNNASPEAKESTGWWVKIKNWFR